MRLYSFTYCRIKLTKKGLKESHRVLGFVLQYIQMLKQKGVEEWVYEEMRQVKKYKKYINFRLDFDFLEKQSPFDYVSCLGARLPNYPINDVLKVGYFSEKYNPEVLINIKCSLSKNSLTSSPAIKYF